MTLASRAAIRGGLMPEISYSMSDVFIQKIEEMTDIVAIYTAIRQFEMEYAKLVAEIRKQDEKNPKKSRVSGWKQAKSISLNICMKRFGCRKLQITCT